MALLLILAGMILYGIGILTGIYVGMSMQKEFTKRSDTQSSKKVAKK